MFGEKINGQAVAGCHLAAKEQVSDPLAGIQAVVAHGIEGHRGLVGQVGTEAIGLHIVGVDIEVVVGAGIGTAKPQQRKDRATDFGIQ